MRRAEPGAETRCVCSSFLSDDPSEVGQAPEVSSGRDQGDPQELALVTPSHTLRVPVTAWCFVPMNPADGSLPRTPACRSHLRGRGRFSDLSQAPRPWAGSPGLR